MISLSVSDSLFSDLKTRFGDTTEAGVLVSRALKTAIEDDVDIAVVKAAYRDAKKYRPYYVSRGLEMRLHKRLDDHKQKDAGATLTSLAMGLIAAVADPKTLPKAANDEAPPANFESWLKNAGLSSRPEQTQMIKGILTGLENKPDGIVLSEASVGVGKSYAKAAVAIQRARTLSEKSANGSVVLAAPTYQIAKQILAATNHLIDSNSLKIKVTLVRSRAEYVSVKLLQEILSEDDSISDKTKAKAVDLLAEGNYLREHYEDAGLECRNLVLSRYSDPDDPAEHAYQRERDKYTDEQIIVCTHAFLACHASGLRRRISRSLKDTEGMGFIEFNRVCLNYLQDNPDVIQENRMLPEVDLLIVDEAHTMAESYQALRDKRISLSALKRTIKKVFASTATKKITQCIDDFIEKAVQSLNQTGTYPPQLTAALVDDLKPLLAKLKSKRNTIEKLLLLEMIDEIRDIAASQSKRHELYMSPVQGLCSIRLQSSHPADWLDFTWLLSKQAVCVSGTLALTSGHNAYMPIAGKLNFDFDRLYSVPAIETSWLRKSVTLHLPAVSNNDKAMKQRYADTAFLPPPHNNAAKYELWVAAQADYIAANIQKTDGGAIIICTSYEQIDLLHTALAEQLTNLDGIHLMQSKQSRSLVSQVAEYKMHYLAGLRPIWIAIISVGTGVDITDSHASADKDRMLNHLFVTRLPFSSKENASLMQRINNSLIQFKQITGRLVRRPGRSNMHLHVMDARSNIKTGIYRRFRLITEKYADQELISPEN